MPTPLRAGDILGKDLFVYREQPCRLVKIKVALNARGSGGDYRAKLLRGGELAVGGSDVVLLYHGVGAVGKL